MDWVGVGIGTAVNRFPTGDGLTVGHHITLGLTTVFTGRSGESKDFINTKIKTVYDHISTYSPPEPDNQDDRSRKKNIFNRMKKHLEQGKQKLKQLRGKTKDQFEQLIRNAEKSLDDWWKGN